jgi:hypothetical protein
MNRRKLSLQLLRGRVVPQFPFSSSCCRRNKKLYPRAGSQKGVDAVSLAPGWESAYLRVPHRLSCWNWQRGKVICHIVPDGFLERVSIGFWGIYLFLLLGQRGEVPSLAKFGSFSLPKPVLRPGTESMPASPSGTHRSIRTSMWFLLYIGFPSASPHSNEAAPMHCCLLSSPPEGQFWGSHLSSHVPTAPAMPSVLSL